MNQPSRPATARFLLRFDDLCPGMNGGKWARFLPMLERNGICPILAVVPNNLDPELEHIADPETDPQPSEFWAGMRHLQANGSSIALHGYQHLCRSTGRSLVPLHLRSEFAGVDESQQRLWIKAGIRLLEANGLNAVLWVAPRHGLDLATIRALASENISMISDGFARKPFRWHGATWLPQQLWAPVKKRSGLWTVCIHPTTASETQVRELESFLAEYSQQFTSVNRVTNEWSIQERSLEDELFHAQTLLRIKASHWKLRFTSRFRPSPSGLLLPGK